MKTTTTTVMIESDDGSLVTEPTPPQPIEGTVELPHTGGLVARWRVWAGEQCAAADGDDVQVLCSLALPRVPGESSYLAASLVFDSRLAVFGRCLARTSWGDWSYEGVRRCTRDTRRFGTYAEGMREQRAYCESESARLVAALNARHAAYVAACAPEPDPDPQDRR